jgi:hypothetical protein
MFVRSLRLYSQTTLGSVAVAQAVQSYGRDNDDASDHLAVFEPREFIDAGEHVTVSMIERFRLRCVEDSLRP